MECICSKPWKSLYFAHDKGVRFCCYNQIKLDKEWSGSGLEEVWNGSVAITVRQKMLAGDWVGAGCLHCPLVRRLSGAERTHIEQGEVAGKRRENALLAKQEFLAKRTHLTSRPVLLHLRPSGVCDLQCVMCDQWNSLNQDNLFDDPSKSQVIDEACSECCEILLEGGEIFVQPSSIHFLRELYLHFGFAGLEGLNIRIITNGQHLINLQDVLELFPLLDLTISMDGAVQETYEAIRHGGSWDNLQLNIRNFQDLCKIRSGWKYHFNYVVMLSTFFEMYDAITLAGRSSIDINFLPIDGAIHEKENIFCFNYLLDKETALAYIDKCIKAVQSYKMRRASTGLIYINKLLNADPWITREKLNEMCMSQSVRCKNVVDAANLLHIYKLGSIYTQRSGLEIPDHGLS